MVARISLLFSTLQLEGSVVIFPVRNVSEDNFQVSLSLNYVEIQ